MPARRRVRCRVAPFGHWFIELGATDPRVPARPTRDVGPQRPDVPAAPERQRPVPSARTPTSRTADRRSAKSLKPSTADAVAKRRRREARQVRASALAPPTHRDGQCPGSGPIRRAPGLPHRLERGVPDVIRLVLPLSNLSNVVADRVESAAHPGVAQAGAGLADVIAMDEHQPCRRARWSCCIAPAVRESMHLDPVAALATMLLSEAKQLRRPQPAGAR